MADEIDKGNEHAAAELAMNIARVRRKAALERTPTGACLNCEEPTDTLYCCDECRDDHHYRLQVQSRKGVNP